MAFLAGEFEEGTENAPIDRCQRSKSRKQTPGGARQGVRNRGQMTVPMTIQRRSWPAGRLPAVLVCALLLCNSGAAFDAASLSQTRISGLVLPIYLRGDSRAAGVIRVEKVFKDSQRRGFFRIGLFPVAVLENVRCQVNRPQDAAAILSEVSGLTRLVRDTKGVEIRGIELRLAGADQPVVEARTAAPSLGGTWSLTGGVKLRVGTQVAQIKSAFLCVTRTNDVTIFWNSRGQTNQMTLFKNP